MFVLMGAGLIVALGFLGAFIWAVRNNQFEDDYTPAIRILFDDTVPETTEASSSETTHPIALNTNPEYDQQS